MRQVSFLVLGIAISITGLFLSVHSSHADTLKAFKSDGCSAFPNGTFAQAELWLAFNMTMTIGRAVPINKG